LFGNKISIRIRGIDTPEIKGKCEAEKTKAKAARKYIKKLMSNAKQIDLINPKRGKYFRIVADIKADGIDVGTLMLKKGFAVPYNGNGKKGEWCN